ncbi:MAG: penicillin-binding transpeptidase domain-containing protein [Lachnospirales bacterium]
MNSEELQNQAYEQQTRDRLINGERGEILDRNLEVLATNITVGTISVVNAEVKDPEYISKILSEKLDLEYDYIYEKVIQKVALNRIKTKVDKTLADEIRNLELEGVKVDEDVKRIYPLGDFASQVIGFVGQDNQGIIGLEAKYDEALTGDDGKIMSEADGRGQPMPNGKDIRVAPSKGESLVTTIDSVIQSYTEQALENALETTQGKSGAIIVMDPNNGEILAMANKPSFDLNEPFTINDEILKSTWDTLDVAQQNDALNSMWRNFSINDTYEPGSTFKIFTSVAGLETGKVTDNSVYTCVGHKIVGNFKIKCWRSPLTHGTLNFVEGVINSCNPVFMTIAEEVGTTDFYKYLTKFNLFGKTGIDLAGEAVGIFHKEEKVTDVDLATMSFGQSFTISPLQLITMVSKVVNGGYDITPHIGKYLVNEEGEVTYTYPNERGNQIISTATSEKIRETLELVVANGTGNKSYIPGYSVGGKTATSEKLPRGNGKYIASFVAFAPAENPEVIALVIINEPVGVYYGGTIAGPVMNDVLSNVLPYLQVERVFDETEIELDVAKEIVVPNLVGLTVNEAISIGKKEGFTIESHNDILDKEKIIEFQFPNEGSIINYNTKVLVD